MQLEQIAVDDLRPAPYNPRIELSPGDPGWERLKRSLHEFDLVQPIVWNRRTGHVVSGHQRLAILRHESVQHVDCIVVDLPLEREQALNVALNNRSVGGDWDPDKLVPLLAELQDLPDFDATLTGFDPQQIRDLLLAPGVAEPARADVAAADAADARITATLEVPGEDWEAVQSRLDDLLADHPSVRLHVSEASIG